MSIESVMKEHTRQEDLRFKEIIDLSSELNRSMTAINATLIRMEERDIAVSKEISAVSEKVQTLTDVVKQNSTWILKNEEFIENLKREKIEGIEKWQNKYTPTLDQIIEDKKDVRKGAIGFFYKHVDKLILVIGWGLFTYFNK